MKCICNQCGMGVKGIACTKCDSELVKDSITKDGGEKIQVAKCPNGCGMIQAPRCCDHDMACQ